MNSEAIAGRLAYTLREVAAKLGVHERTVKRAIERGELPRPIRLGTCVRIPAAELDAFLARKLKERP